MKKNTCLKNANCSCSVCGALAKVVAIFGSQKIFAKKIGVEQASVSRWFKNGVPPDKVLKVEKLGGGVTTRYQLRPDLYPKD